MVGFNFGFGMIVGTYFLRSDLGGEGATIGLGLGLGFDFSSSRRFLSYSRIFARNRGEVSSSDCNERAFIKLREESEGRRPPR